jgi:hypothetical protein
MENMNLGRTFRIGGGDSGFPSVRMEFTNIFNRAYWGDPTGDVDELQSAANVPGNGNTSAGFGRVLTESATAFGTTANLLPRQGSLVARFSF